MYKFVLDVILASALFYVGINSGIYSLQMATVFLMQIVFAELISGIIETIHVLLFNSLPDIVELFYKLIGSWLVMLSVLYFAGK